MNQFVIMGNFQPQYRRSPFSPFPALELLSDVLCEATGDGTDVVSFPNSHFPTLFALPAFEDSPCSISW